MRIRDEDAVSEVLGSVLLVALTVVLLAGFSGVVLSSILAEAPEPPTGTFSIEPREGDSRVNVTFVSGEAFRLSEASLVLLVDSSPAIASWDAVNGTDGRYHPGARLRLNLTAPLAEGDALLLLIVDQQTGKPIGTARATVPTDAALPAYVSDEPSVFALSPSLRPSPLVADGVRVSNLSVRAFASRGLALVESVTADLTPIGGSSAARMRDDGRDGDLVAGDGIYTVETTARNVTFPSSHGAHTVNVVVRIRDALGHTNSTTVTLTLVPPAPPTLVTGTSFGPIPSSAQLGWLNLTSFSVRNFAQLGSDQMVVRIIDTATPGTSWEAAVDFVECGGGVVGVSAIRYTIISSGSPTATQTFTPTTCIPLASPTQLDLTEITAAGAWSGPNANYTGAGISSSNLGTVAFLGDKTTASPTSVGLAGTGVNWGTDTMGLPTAPQSLAGVTGNGTVSLSWAAPVSDGGSPITEYRIYLNGTLLATTPGNVSFVVNGLQNGVAYTFSVRAVTAAGEGPSSGSIVSTPSTLPFPPIGLVATAGDGQATLSWTPGFNGGSGLTGYTILLNNSTLATTTNGANTSFVVNGLTNGATYTFTVRATNALGTSAVSNFAYAVPTATAVAPGAPQSLAVSNATGAGTLAVSWSAPASDGGSPITAYDVWRSTDGVTYALATTTNAATTSFIDTGLAPGATRYYKVAAVNAVGVGPNATAVSATTWNVPTAPTSLAVTNGTGAGALSVTWAAPLSNGGAAITGYDVWRSTDGVTFTLATSTNAATTSFVDSGLGPAATRYYKVAAINAAGVGPNATAVSATTWNVPTAPQALAVTNATGAGTLAVSWSAPSSDGGTALTAYNVWRSTDGVTFTLATTTAPGVTSWSDTGLGAGATRYYKVAAVNAAGVGPNATAASATTWNVPTAPTALSVSNATGAGALALSWTAPSSNGGAAIALYDVWRSTDGVTYARIATAAGTTFTDTGLGNNALRYYKVAAVNAAGVGPNSTAASATTWNVPGAPTGLLAVAGNTQVTLSWTAPTNNGGESVDDYTITYGTSCASLTSSTTVGSAATTKIVTGLTNGVTYCFAVAATNAAGTGPASGTASATPAAGATVPGAPTSLVATPANNQVALNWTAPVSDGGSALTGYTIHRSTTSGSYGAALATVSASNLTFTDKTALNNVTYYYVVRATNAIGSSANSNEASAAPSANVNIDCSTFTMVAGMLPEGCSALFFGGGTGEISETGAGGPNKESIFDFRMNVTGITGTQTLELRGQRGNGPEDMVLQAWNPSTSTYVTIVTLPSTATSMTTFTGTLNMATYATNGQLLLRLRDAGPDSNNSSWIVDHVRMVTT